MSDEESFVILGTSPLSSMASMSSQQQQHQESLQQHQQSLQQQREAEISLSHSCSPFQSLKSSAKAAEIADALTESTPKVDSMDVSNKCSPFQSLKTSAKTADALSQTPSQVDSLDAVIVPPKAQPSNMTRSDSSNNTRNSLNGPQSNRESLAASFILGEVNADVLKTSVYSQFPSLCSMEACAEDVVKLQNFMSEYVELKNTLSMVNNTMKQFYHKTQQWKDDMQRMEEDYKKQLHECQLQIAELRNENLELKRVMTTQIEQVQLTDELRQKEYDEMLRAVSEKTSVIENMRTQIIKLENQQLASYEYISKNATDTKEQPEYVARPEHERVTKQMQRDMSELLAKNLDLTDVQKQYIDEINCLKVNLTAAEELIQQHRAEINMLKAQSMDKSVAFSEFQLEREQIRAELDAMRHQVDVFSRDFQMEREARTNLAGVNEQLLQDLRALQRKNQELIEQEQKRYEAILQSTQAPKTTAAAAATAVVANVAGGGGDLQPLPAPSGSIVPRCPICSKTFKNLSILQSHVNDCLDKN